jgi:catechol 2,3-dioxygenase-like lactoylglutathione lyase family enzyme
MAAKKRTARKAAPKKSAAKKAAPKSTQKKAAPPPAADAGKLTFNHAMIYTKDVQKSLGFYAGLLGFKLIEDFRYENTPVYARLRAPGGDGTIALHLVEPGTSTVSEGVRMYFEIQDLDGFVEKLKKKGVYFPQPPRMMPWGWKHAYMNDPDGHEISLYWAGEKRMKKSVMAAAKEAAKVPVAKRPRR